MSGVLFSSLSLGPGSTASGAASSVTTATAPTGSPSIATVDFTSDSAATHLAYKWNWTVGGEGALHIFVDGVLVREMDERFVTPESLTGEDIPIGIDGPGTHSIIFRLDGFGSSPSRVELTNVRLSYDPPLSRRRSVAH